VVYADSGCAGAAVAGAPNLPLVAAHTSGNATNEAVAANGKVQPLRSVFAVSGALLLASCAGGSSRSAASPREISQYSHTLHARFYRAWVQPAAVRAPRGRISVPVDVRIDKRGRITSYELVRPSGYAAVDASIEAVGKRVRKVPRPPTDSEYRLRIFFDLDVKR
jgi:TonB family protein